MEKSKTSKYLKYALGEILLVMIGILLALQVNNWNESYKDKGIEKEYLVGIKQDLKQDIIQASELISGRKAVLNIVNLLEPQFELDSQLREESIDTTSLDFIALFQRGYSFRSTDGTYTALITDGKTSLITNKGLFKNIQGIYDITYPRIYSIYDDFKERESNLTSKYSYEKFHWDYKTLMRPEHKRTVSDIANFQDTGRFYSIFLGSAIVEMKKIIDEINTELENK